MDEEITLLWRLANLGMGVAQRLHDTLLTTEDLDAQARIGVAFHHVSRGVRQSLALEARLAAGWTPVARPAKPEPPATDTQPPTPERAAREPTEPTGWNEYERLDCDELVDELDRLADTPEDEPIDLERLDAALEAGVARLRRGVRALRPRPVSTPRRAPRASLMAGAAVLRLVDSS